MNFLGLLGVVAVRFLAIALTRSEVLATTKKSSATAPALRLHIAFLHCSEEKFRCSIEPQVSVI